MPLDTHVCNQIVLYKQFYRYANNPLHQKSFYTNNFL